MLEKGGQTWSYKAPSRNNSYKVLNYVEKGVIITLNYIKHKHGLDCKRTGLRHPGQFALKLFALDRYRT